MSRTFPKGGVHPPDNKLTAGIPVETLPLPETAVVLLSQHIGAPAEPVVTVGEKVLTGQLIGRAAGFISANVHSPVSGVVSAVGLVADGSGMRRMAVTIKVEGDEWMPQIDRSERFVKGCPLSPEEIVAKVAEAGIVGLGGAAFPTQVKLTPLAGRQAEILIINGAECEPYLTADHRLMLEKGREVLTGASILAKALGVEKTYIGIENNKRDAIEHLRRAAQDFLAMEVVTLKTRYPQGGEKQLIAAVTGRRVPSGKLPVDVGVVVHNTATAFAVYEAVQKNKPLIERIVTVTGKNVRKPSNFLVRIGTPVSALIDAAGGLPNDTVKVINGGPMMGRAMSDTDAAVVKATGGVVVMNGKQALRRTETACIMCAKCVDVCPMGLAPYLLSKMSQKQMWEDAQRNGVGDCIECGSCAYICPASLPLLDWVRLGKTEAAKIVRSRAAAQ